MQFQEYTEEYTCAHTKNKLLIPHEIEFCIKI